MLSHKFGRLVGQEVCGQKRSSVVVASMDLCVCLLSEPHHPERTGFVLLIANLGTNETMFVARQSFFLLSFLSDGNRAGWLPC